jgi:HSF-type DNA-binding
MLDRAEELGLSHIISWQPHGRCFVVHDRDAFLPVLSLLMPGMTKWKSFQRQLLIWGFTRITKGLDKGGHFHEYFLRFRSHLLRGIRRASGRREEFRYDPEREPNFYAMSVMTPLLLSSVLANDELTSSWRQMGPNTSHEGTFLDLHAAEGLSLSPLAEACELELAAFDSIACTAREGNRTSGVTTHEPLHGSQPTESTFNGSLVSRAQVSTDHDAPDTLNDVETGNASSIASSEITTPLAPDLEPTPLPPVMAFHGETIQPWYITLPVAQHPSFVQSSVHKFDGSQCEYEFAADAATATSGESATVSGT